VTLSFVVVVEVLAQEGGFFILIKQVENDIFDCIIPRWLVEDGLGLLHEVGEAEGRGLGGEDAVF